MNLVEHLRTWDDIPDDDAKAFHWLDVKTAEAADLIEKQSAQIEMLREALEAAYNGLRWWMDAFPLYVTGADNEEILKIVKVISATPDQALEQFAERVLEQVIEACSDGTGPSGNLLPLSTVAKIRAIKEIP